MFKKTHTDTTTSTTSTNASTSGHKKFGFRRHKNTTTTNAVAPVQGTSTQSDWDHYAVRHEDSLIGDPIPIVEPGRVNKTNNTIGVTNANVNNTTGFIGNDRNTSQQNVLTNQYGTVAPGPVVSTEAIKGNYSTGTVVESPAVYGLATPNTTTSYGPNTHGYTPTKDQVIAENASRGWSDPLYGPTSTTTTSSWSAPLYTTRDVRDTKTPLLPDNPWTHNELGREYVDAYKSGTLPNKSIDARSTITETVVTETTQSRQRVPVAAAAVPVIASVPVVASVPSTSRSTVIPPPVSSTTSIPIPPPNPPVYQFPTSRLSTQRNQGLNIPIQSTDSSQFVAVDNVQNQQMGSAVRESFMEENTVIQRNNGLGYKNELGGVSSGVATEFIGERTPPLAWYTGRESMQNTQPL